MLDPKPFLDRLFDNMEKAGLRLNDCELDHVCYRVETLAEYEQLKTELSNAGVLLHEAMIGGRPIATYELRSPLQYERAGRTREIFLVELPSPKPGSPYRSGLEHAEFVIDEPFAAFMARYAHLKFDTSGTEKAVNAELRICFADCSVKFHHQSLKAVIALEKNVRGDG